MDVRIIDGFDMNPGCLKCRRKRINSTQFCGRCFATNSQIVNSGNINIDDFIKETQSPYRNINVSFLEWAPYDEFTNIEYIGKGGFSQIYKATWKKHDGINYILNGGFNGTCDQSKKDVVLKVLKDSQNVDTEFLNELKHTFQFDNQNPVEIIRCFGVTQEPQTKNYAFILEYARNGDLQHFVYKNFEEFTWKKKIQYFYDIIGGINRIHGKKIIHRDLHSGNILVVRLVNRSRNDCAVISDLGFSQPATIDSNLSRKSQIYGIIPYMAPELFKNQPHSYASDIYSLGMIMWQLTSGHRPFHDQEHGPKLISDILDGKRPEITEDTPECWANLMKRCWHPDPSQRPTIQKIYELSEEYIYYYDSEYYSKKDHPDKYEEFKKAEDKRLEMIKLNKPFVTGCEHPNSRYYSTSLNSMLGSINSTITDPLSKNDFDIMNINSNQEINFEHSDRNSSLAENSKKLCLNELLQEENIEDQHDFKRRKIVEYFDECFAENDMD
ncbi:hypothetical protein Glove_346g100 [Diversispora epigaea]|uniref:Protein kinase domain-containing protein n=1 Tax=Diversispora epigaea TaxID=1348612 RepID=A0A397HJF0_9GLOM|nr:hypothetical protein Glove_346g100 [Diversispora epigaea]